MKLELALYRGTMLWLNGKKSPTSWSCDAEGNVMTCTGLEVDGHNVEKIEVHGKEFDDCYPEHGVFFIFDNAIVPETITLTTDKGVYRGKVEQITVGDMDAEPPTSVTLESGEKYEIDEITLYLKATLTG